MGDFFECPWFLKQMSGPRDNFDFFDALQFAKCLLVQANYDFVAFAHNQQGGRFHFR